MNVQETETQSRLAELDEERHGWDDGIISIAPSGWNSRWKWDKIIYSSTKNE